MKIIPAIDLIDGKCVRLRQGDYAQKTVYHEDPLEVAKKFEAAGLSYLHLVDLDGARSGGVVNWKVLERIATHTNLEIDFGGGIKQRKDLHIALESGARQVTVGSTAARQPALFYEWLEEWGPERIILGADARDGKIAVQAWQETTELQLTDFIGEFHARGGKYVICTDIAQDGTLAGPATATYRSLLEEFSGLQLIASGGVGATAHLHELREAGLPGVIVGKAIYEGRIPLEDLRRF